MNTKFLIKNATLLTLCSDQDGQTGDILIQDGVIGRIDKSIEDKNAETIDATDMVVMPGFVQTHIHLCQTLFKNLANDLELLDWLEQRIWPLEAAHNNSSMSISARLGILELIKSGTTTILDMGSIHFTNSILEEVAKSGLRASIGVTFMDSGQNIPSDLCCPAQESLSVFDHLHKTWHGSSSGRIFMNLAPRFALSCSEKVLGQIANLSKEQNLLIHTHAAENRKEVALIKKKHNMGNVAYYHQQGMTGKNLCLAHCIWLDEEEIEIIAETGTRVLHCPSSNLKLGSGIANIPYYLKKGILCSLAADGAPCNNNLNMFNEMRLAGLIQKPVHGPKVMPALNLVKMATSNGAQTIHLEDQIGSLEVGKKADIILIDLNTPHTISGGDIYSQLVFSAQGENVNTVFIDGKLVMRNRQVLTIDEEDTINRAKEELNFLLRRAKL